jgi:hypothetical protein
MMLLLIVVVALTAVLVGDDDVVDEKAWKLTSCETQNLTHSLSPTFAIPILIFIVQKQTNQPLEINFLPRRARAENSNSRFETLEPVISAGSSVGNDSKTPVDRSCSY